MRGLPSYLPIAEKVADNWEGGALYRAAIYRVRPFQRIVASGLVEPLYSDEAEAVRHAAKAITQAIGARRDQ
jgi:hypothetical protein